MKAVIDCWKISLYGFFRQKPQFSKKNSRTFSIQEFITANSEINAMILLLQIMGQSDNRKNKNSHFYVCSLYLQTGFLAHLAQKAVSAIVITLCPSSSSTVNFSPSSLKPLNRFQPNLADMLDRWSFSRFVKLVPI